VIPDRDDPSGDVRSVHEGSGQAALVLGVLLVVVGIAALATLWVHVQWDAVWPLMLIGLGATMVVVATRARR
jgi:uncharacterized membrane protein YhhN